MTEVSIEDQIKNASSKLVELLRKASVAQVGGFRPPENPISSWFGGRGVGLEGEALPPYNGKDMFPLMQIRTDELPFVPEELADIALLVVFMNREKLPIDQVHGDGWMIREYESLDGLMPLPASAEQDTVKSFPILWNLIKDDAPGWEDLTEVVDWPQIEDNTNTFHDTFKTHEGTKVGGYPFEVQHGVGLKDYVFQIDSEYKAGWSWGDQGIGYFHKTDGVWRLDWQCL